MLELSGDDRRALHEAILSAYPDPDDLAALLDYSLSKNLAAEAGGGRYKSVVHKLIQQAIAKGYIEALVLALAKDLPNRKDIQQLCAQVLRQRLLLNSAKPGTTESALDLDPNAWDLDVHSAELELFLPKQFSFEADVGLLRQGLDLAKSVCKITFSDRPAAESGTGVLVASDLVLTNYHVLSREADADLNQRSRNAQFEFGYISAQLGESSQSQTVMAAEVAPVIASSPISELDYALIRLSFQSDFSIKPVPLSATAVLGPRSPLNILQHPAGEALKVSLSNNGVVKTNDAQGLVLYVNPTQRGSSGSPCFDDQWQLVALHHKNMQTSFGSVREGILLSAIYRHVQQVAAVTL